MVYRYIDETHKQPLGLKTSLEIDEEGKLYFVMQNEFEKKHCDDTFPIELFIYKKGKPFYVTARGIAEKNNTLTPRKKEEAKTSTVSIQMNEVEYYELDGDPTISPWKRMINRLSNIQAAF